MAEIPPKRRKSSIQPTTWPIKYIVWAIPGQKHPDNEDNLIVNIETKVCSELINMIKRSWQCGQNAFGPVNSLE